MKTGKRVRRFFGTPKGLLLLLLVAFAGLAATVEGFAVVAPNLVAASAAAGALDLVVLRIRKGVWEFPSGALLTGLIVAMVLRPQEPWHVAAITSAVAVLSKYVIRSRSANIFNPAALALVVMFYVFDSGHSWWGALGELPPAALAVLVAGGIFIADRVNKMPMVLAWLGTYYLLFTVTAFASDPGVVAEIYRAPDLHAALYFAFIILTDPPTSPTKYRDQVICSVLIAIVSYGVFEWLGAAYYLLAGVLAGNVWEAWRRWHVHRQREQARARVHRSPAVLHLASDEA